MSHEAEVEGIAVAVGESGEPAPAVLLAVHAQYVPIFIGPGQAQSISMAHEGATPADDPRPPGRDGD